MLDERVLNELLSIKDGVAQQNERMARMEAKLDNYNELRERIDGAEKAAIESGKDIIALQGKVGLHDKVIWGLCSGVGIAVLAAGLKLVLK